MIIFTHTHTGTSGVGDAIMGVGESFYFASGNHAVFRINVTAHGSSKGSAADVSGTEAGCICQTASTCVDMPTGGGPPYYKIGDNVLSNYKDGGVFYGAKITAVRAVAGAAGGIEGAQEVTVAYDGDSGITEGPMLSSRVKWLQTLDQDRTWCEVDAATCADDSSPKGTTWDYCDAASLASEYLDVTVAVLAPATTKSGCACKAEYKGTDGKSYYGNCATDAERGGPYCATTSCPAGVVAAGNGWDTCASTCHGQQYKDAATGKCLDWTVCPQMFHQTQAPSLTTDRTCAPNAGTPSGCTCQASYTVGGATFNGECTTASLAVGVSDTYPWCYVDCWGEGDTADGGEGTDAAPLYSYCAQCALTQYLDGVTGECTDLTLCALDEHETRASGTMSDRVCKQNTICTPRQFVRKQATQTTDRQCGDDVTCTKEEYELVSADKTSTRICEKLRVCDPTTE